MTMKLVFFFLLMFVAFSTEKKNAEEILLKQKLEQKKETLQQREHDVNAAIEWLHAREEKFRKAQEKNFSQMEQWAQKLQKLEAELQKREQNIMAAEIELRKEKEKFHVEKQTLQKQRELAHEENILSDNENMCGREKSKEKIEIMSQILGPCNLFPNESDIKVFYDAERRAYFWEDSKSLIRNDIKEKIVLSLQQEGEAMSNGLFFLISDWYVPTAARPFVKKLVFAMSKNINVGKRNERNETPLMLALYFNSKKAVAKFIEQGADIEVANNIGDTAIHWGATSGSRSSCEILLQKGANVNVQNNIGDTAIHCAAMNGHAEIVRLLLESGADAKIKNKTRLTAKNYATQDCAAVIKAHETKTRNQNKERFPIQISRQKPFAREQNTHSKYTNMLEREKPKEKLQTTSNLSNIFPNESSVKVFKNAETNVFSWEDPHGLIEDKIKGKIESSLTQKGNAMANGLFDCVSDWYSPQKINPFVKEILFVMAANVDIDKRDQCQCNPLSMASKYDAEEAVVKLLERNAKMEAVDEDGNTALHRASYYGSKSCCGALMQKGANVNAQNIYGNTPLMNTVANGNVDIVKHILQSGADITVKNKLGMTALDYLDPNRAGAMQDAFRAHEAILNKQRALSALKKSLQSNNVNMCDHQKPKEIDTSKGKISEHLNLFPNESSIKVFRNLETNEISWEDPKNLISKKKKEKIESSLQQKGEAMSNALFDCFSNFEVSPKAKPFVKELLFSMSENINVDKRSKHFQTPIMLAVKFDGDKAVVKLIEKSIVKMLETVDEYGLTALDLAAYFGNKCTCKILLQNGANVNSQNKNSLWTPLMFATNNGKNVEVIKLLLKFGADSTIQNKSGKTALDYAEPNCAEVIREHESKLIN